MKVTFTIIHFKLNIVSKASFLSIYPILQENADFQYIDLWSSQFTWGGTSKPEEGDFVVIPSDMTVLLDESPPVLKFILIQGGKLIFDDVDDLHLQSEMILITSGGLLQVIYKYFISITTIHAWLFFFVRSSTLCKS